MKQPIKKSVAKANDIDTSKYETTLIVDGNNLMKISLVDKTMNSEGKEYGAVVNFIRMLGKVLLKKDFNYCIVVFDGEGSGVLRWELYNDYKANRDKHYELHTAQTAYDKAINAYCKKVLQYSRDKKKVAQNAENEDESFDRQKMIIKSILEELCIRQYEYENVEGDDIISYYVHHKRENEKVVIMSSDKDLTQLISDTVIVYNPRLKDGDSFINSRNSVEKLGIRYDNVVLEKIICGDSSDNIKGIKGVGEQTLVKLFPQINEQKLDLSFVVARSKELLEERKVAKKKPLKTLENIVNCVTDGCQGKEIYEINKKIIDLSEPLLTDEAKNDLDESLYSPMDTSDRTMKNIYRIVLENNMEKIMDEGNFGRLFTPYARIRMMEDKRYKEYIDSEKKC